MNHRVTDVQLLYDDSKALYDKVVTERADSIINNLNQTVSTLKNSWEGKDASVQINNVVDVYNAMVKIRNALAQLALDSSLVATKYREIQNANRSNMETLVPLMEPYTDNRDTISITAEAMNGKNMLDNVTNMYDEFKSEVNRYYQAIMGNWQAGPKRDEAVGAFDEFMASSSKYQQILEEVSQSITDAIANYMM